MLIKACRWLGNKLSSIPTLLFGPSWDDPTPKKQEVSLQEEPTPHDVNCDNTRLYPCQFCHQSGKDRFKLGSCRVCNGQGTVERSLKNPIDCNHCQGRGVEPYHSQQCKVCGGSGVIEKIEESPHKSKIPIIYSSPEKLNERHEIDSLNDLHKSKQDDHL